MSLTEPLPRHRYLGIDVVRLLSFMAITIHHFVWVLWYSAAPEEQTHFGWHWTSAFARAISFSGHSILFLSVYLIARTETRISKTLKVVALVGVGWWIFSLFYLIESPQNQMFWFWDIYPLIALGLATALVASRISTKFIYTLGVVGFAMTWIKFWDWQYFETLSLQWRHALVGDCRVDLADWPILPWIGIIWLPYAIGTWDRVTETTKASRFDHWRKWEWFAWPLVLLPSIPQLGAWYHIQLGPMFGCFSFRQEPIVFWGNFVFVILLLRLSLLDRVQAKLEGLRVVRAIGSLRLSQSFGVSYLTHYVLIEVITSVGKPWLAPNSNLALLALCAILPLTEISVRGMEKVVIRLRKVSSKPGA